MTTEVVPGLVSIVIPCFKGARWLAEAIESCLRQSYELFEVIVVDDASPDSCAVIAEWYAHADSRVKLVRRPQNGGVSRAFNSGFEVARGEFFTRLAQDDRFEPNAVSRMAGRLRETGAGLVYCDFVQVDESRTVLRRVDTPEPRSALRFANDIGLCVMWTRRVWDKIGGFDPGMDTAEDFDYWLRTIIRFPFAKSEGGPAMQFRIHGDMGSVQFARKQDEAAHSALIKAKRLGRFQFGPRWLHRQVAAGYARQQLAYAAIERACFSEALRQALLSLLDWPFPYPRLTPARKPSMHGLRMAASLTCICLRDFLRPRQDLPNHLRISDPTPKQDA